MINSTSSILNISHLTDPSLTSRLYLYNKVNDLINTTKDTWTKTLFIERIVYTYNKIKYFFTDSVVQDNVLQDKSDLMQLCRVTPMRL